MATLTSRCSAFGMLMALCITACSPPSDPVRIGALCSQETAACPAHQVLERGVVQGRNAIDYELSNLSTTTQRAIVRVGPAAVFEEVFTDDLTPGVVSPEEEAELTRSSFYMVRKHILEPGASVLDRLTADELGRESRLWLSVECEEAIGCDLNLDYVLIVDPLECVSREDCLSGWECDVERGRCLECIAGESMCATEQTCELGRCTPPQQSTCQSVAGTSDTTPPWGMALLWCALLCIGHHTRRFAASHGRAR